MKEKWTPGPWVFTAPIGAEHAEVRDRDGRRIAVTIGSYPMRTRTEDANAYLIAAAPDLYAALDELHDLVNMMIEGEYEPDSFTIQPARLALKKARGES